MPNSANQVVYAEQFVRKLRGSCQPILVRASDGLLYVAKFAKNLQGPNVLFNESAGTELYRAFGLSVPSWKQLVVTGKFVDRNPGCWMQTDDGARRPESGLCFASQFLGTGESRLLEILSGGAMSRVRNQMSFWMAWLLDICAEHADNRQALFLESPQGGTTAFFVDHGHQFGGPHGEKRLHFLTSRYLDPRIYPHVGGEEAVGFLKAAANLNFDLLWRRVKSLPADWKTETALSNFAECLSRLADPLMLRDIFDTLVESVQGNGSIQRQPEAGRKAPILVSFPIVPAMFLASKAAPSPLAFPACA